MALIEAKNITVDQRVKAATFSLHQGEVLGLLGPNGAGKSTLLNALAGLEVKTGAIYINGQEDINLSHAARARIVGLLPQSMLSAWSLTVTDIVSLGRIPWGDSNSHSDASNEAIQQAMRCADVEQFAERKVDTLSGGERARVWLARVLAGQPRILLADEPIASLDIHYQLSVMNVLKAYARQGHGVIVALHDLSLAVRYCDRVCLMSSAAIVAQGSPHEVCNEALLTSVYDVGVYVDLTRHPPVILPR